MNRALRLAAILSLIAAVVFVAVVKASPSPLEVGSQTFYQLPYSLFALTSLLLAVAVGVATATVAAWRGQRAWLILLVAALLIVAYGLIVFFFYLPSAAFLAFVTALPFLSVNMLRQAVVPALLPLLALAYTWWPRRAPASEPIPASSTSTRSTATDRTLRLLAALALLVALSVIPFMAYVAAGEPGIETGAAGQRLLGLWGPMFGQTIHLLAFGVGVAALTDAMWRRQRAWAWGLLVTLLVVAYGVILFNYFFVFGQVNTLLKRLPDWLLQQYPSANLLGGGFTTTSGNLLGDVIIPALLALVVLVYTLRPHWMGSSSASGSERAPSQPPTTGQVEPVA